MIEEVSIKNFKSLADLCIRLDRFNCFVGMNGSGKTSILQALDFISQQMHGDLTKWFDERGWKPADIGYKGNGGTARASFTELEVKLRLSKTETLSWLGLFSRKKLQLVAETARIVESGRSLLRTDANTYEVDGTVPQPLNFNYQGSILSQLKDSFLPEPLIHLRDALKGIRSLELLSPHLLRKRSRSHTAHIGVGGEKLSGFLDGIKGEAKDGLVAQLKDFYPSLEDYRISTSKGGWKSLHVTEARQATTEHGLRVLETEAGHLNDGLLRILAILAEAKSTGSTMLLLDEIENGINPEIVEKLVDRLVSAPLQMIVTTHSPMILNYLTDAVAKQSVQFIYKDEYGRTNVRPLFTIPRIEKKLDYMGPGEAFVDTDLVALARDCILLDSAGRVGTVQK